MAKVRLLQLQLLSLLSITGTASAYQSFEEWRKGKTYASKTEERRRKAIYESNLDIIVMHNNRIRNGHDSHHWLGINQFMDLEDHELPRGYDKSLHRAPSTNTRTTRRKLDQEDPILDDLLQIEPVQDLPKVVDWRFAATPVKDQGQCGSCWAFASIAALESHLYLNDGLLYSLSVQELVSCAPNVKQCGGQGGCTGATSVQAYDYLKKSGVVQEWTFGYGSYDGSIVECSLVPQSDNANNNGQNNVTLVKGTVATIDGFITLPPNNYTIMMNAIAKLGPVVISVAATGWGLYAGGVFHHNFTDVADADINHAVVLMGYGTDEETGEDYWLVRNSWSPRWGEAGYIRLFREDPTESDNQCAMDVTPGDGDACRYDDHGEPIDPLPAQKICGTSGAYYMGYIPIGVSLV